MLRTVVFLLALFAVAQAHFYVLGSRGNVTPASANYFSVNSLSPCGGVAASSAQYLNVTGKLTLFTVSLS
jgi:hypothetical protein